MNKKTAPIDNTEEKEPPSTQVNPPDETGHLLPDKQSTVFTPEEREVSIEEMVEEIKKMFCYRFFFNFLLPCLLVAFWGFLIGVSQIIWEKTLLACDYDVIVCIKWLKKKFMTVIYEILAYALIHFYVFVHGIYHSKPYIRATGMSLALISFGYRYVTSHGFSAIDHSKANVQLAGFMMAFLFFIYFCFWVTVKMFKSSRKKGALWIFFWGSFWLILFYKRILKSCDHLQDSLDDDYRYSNSEGDCKWVKGDICWHYTIDGIFQPLFWGRDDCRKIETNLTMHHEL